MMKKMFFIMSFLLLNPCYAPKGKKHKNPNALNTRSTSASKSMEEAATTSQVSQPKITVEAPITSSHAATGNTTSASSFTAQKPLASRESLPMYIPDRSDDKTSPVVLLQTSNFQQDVKTVPSSTQTTTQKSSFHAPKATSSRIEQEIQDVVLLPLIAQATSTHSRSLSPATTEVPENIKREIWKKAREWYETTFNTIMVDYKSDQAEDAIDWMNEESCNSYNPKTRDEFYTIIGNEKIRIAMLSDDFIKTKLSLRKTKAHKNT